jgi:hypothetical protein
MGNFSKANIDFSRQTLLGKSGRPSPAIAIYPRNTGNTKLEIQILPNASLLSIRYVSTTTVTKSVTYANKSVEQVVQEINELTFPLKAISLSEFDILRQGDLISPSASFVGIPKSFSVYDRLEGSGILIRCKKIAVKHKDQSNIKVLPPYADDKSLPWYPRILNGSFSQKYNNKLYHFYIPEFNNQSWSTLYGKPFKDVIGATPVPIDKSVYRLPRFPIYWNGQNIAIYNNDIPLSNTIIQDIDINNGILYLDPQTSLDQDVSIDYVYLENSYVYKDVNINGHFSQNPFILDKFVIIYMVPVEATTVANKRTVFHVIGDSIESAIDSIIAPEGTPIAIIGAYNIQSIVASDKINILDTRSKGGGLKKSSGPTSAIFNIDNPILPDTVEIEEIYSDSYRFWDIGNIDGEAYPAAAAVSVELPEELKEVLDITEIKKKASKFIAAGVYPSISFYSRELPAITGLSRQVSCAYNLDLNDVFYKSFTGNGVTASIPNVFTGAGWRNIDNALPGSIFTGDWSSYYPLIPTKKVDNKNVIEVDTYNGIGFTYLKSSPDAGVSWSERTVKYNSGIADIPIEYSNWEKKTVIDTKFVETGEIRKNYFYINPENVIKQYTDFKVNSPYQPDNLIGKLETSISSILDNILQLQTTGYNKDEEQYFTTAIKNSYSNVLDKSQKGEIGNYLLSPNIYSPFFKLTNTYLEEKYGNMITKIGEDFITHGTYQSGHYFKFFLQASDTYYRVEDGGAVTLFEFNDRLKDLNRYLNYRYRKGTWNNLCDSGSTVSFGLVNKLMSSDALFGDFDPAIPTYWVYYPTYAASGIYVDYFSGYYVPSIADLGTTYSEVLQEKNYDFLYTDSLPSIVSCVLSATGQTIGDSTTISSLQNAYSYAVDNVVDKVGLSVNGVRFYSGLPTTSHWFVGHNRLGVYLGKNLSNLIETYDYIYEYNKNRENVYDNRYPSSAGPNFLSYIFSGIENILETAYDVVYNNILRQGVTEPEVADTIRAYGWYVSAWARNYGTVGKTYSTDNRQKYYSLFSNSLNQIIKNQINEEGIFTEVKSIFGEPGAFPAITPAKILYPLAEGLKINKEIWEGVAEGVVSTLLNNYFVSGLYYSDPYLVNTQAGREHELAEGLISIYNALASTGSNKLFEPIFTGFDNLRGAKFLPNFNSYNEALPTGDWQGTINSLSFWKYYHSGDVEQSISSLKSIGINSLSVDLDYMLWKVNSGLFYSNLDHLINTCVDNRISVIPNFFNDGGSTISESNFISYVNSFGHTGSKYRSEATDSFYLMTGSLSGSSYILDTVARYDNSPSVIAWSIVDNPVANGNNIMNYNAIAYLIDGYTDTLTLYNLGKVPSKGDVGGLPDTESDAEEAETTKYTLTDIIYPEDIYGRTAPIYNPRIDFIGASPSPIFNYFIDTLPVTTKKYVLYNYGDGAYGDYSLCISRAYNRLSPFILSNLYVKSGSYEGIIYNNLDCRISRQVTSIKNIAYVQSIPTTGNPIQVKDYTDKYFYESDYIPSYNGVNLLFDIVNWNLRPVKTPLQSFNTGEFKKQIAVLKVLQSGLDTLNDTYYTDYYSSNKLATEDKQNLNYYRNQWDSADFISDSSKTWLLNGSIDNKRYDDFVTEWGLGLKNICRRLNING